MVDNFVLVTHGALVVAGYVLVAWLAAVVLCYVLWQLLALYNERLYQELKVKFEEEHERALQQLQQSKQDDDLRALADYRSESDIRCD